MTTIYRAHTDAVMGNNHITCKQAFLHDWVPYLSAVITDLS